jgi:hypothetical protein
LHFRDFISRPCRHFLEAADAVNNLWLNRDQGGVSETVAAAAWQDVEGPSTNIGVAINPSRFRISVPGHLGGSNYAWFPSS